VLDALHRLTEQGLVRRVELNRALLFSLNREHLAAPAVIALAGLRSELVARLRREIAAWEPEPIHASLFGSAARGDGDPSSDVDVFVVRPAAVVEHDRRWQEQTDALAEKVESWTGNRASILEIAEGELPRLRAERPAIVEDLSCDAITLAGPPAGPLLEA
jgi:predicted nucleotidyltransferase